MLGSNTSTFETDVREARTHMLADSFKVARREGASGKVETAIAGRVASEAPSCVNAHRESPACGAAWTDVTRATAVRIETKTITLVPTLDPPTRRIRGHDFKADARWKEGPRGLRVPRLAKYLEGVDSNGFPRTLK